MKLNLATVGFVLLGFALASPEPISEPEIEVRGQPSCSSYRDMHTCRRTRACEWEPKYECVDSKHAPGKGKRCSAPSRVDNKHQCNKHPWCEWVCRDPHKGKCKSRHH